MSSKLTPSTKLTNKQAAQFFQVSHMSLFNWRKGKGGNDPLVPDSPMEDRSVWYKVSTLTRFAKQNKLATYPHEVTFEEVVAKKPGPISRVKPATKASAKAVRKPATKPTAKSTKPVVKVATAPTTAKKVVAKKTATKAVTEAAGSSAATTSNLPKVA